MVKIFSHLKFPTMINKKLVRPGMNKIDETDVHNKDFQLMVHLNQMEIVESSKQEKALKQIKKTMEVVHLEKPYAYKSTPKLKDAVDHKLNRPFIEKDESVEFVLSVSYKDALEEIEKVESLDTLKTILKKDPRTTIMRAVKKKIAKLTESNIKEEIKE